MRNYLQLLLTVLLLTLVGCGGSSSTSENDTPQQPQSTQAPIVATFTSTPDEAPDVVAEPPGEEAEEATATPGAAEEETEEVEPEPTATESATATPTPTPTVMPTPTATLVAEEDELTFASLSPTYFGVDELRVVQQINDYRIGLGLWPLRYDARLQVMAVDQANYLAEQIAAGAFPDYEDIHRGRTGAFIRERALLFDWEFYGNRDQTAAGEVAYVGSTTNEAVTFWSGSSIHNSTITGTGYRYIGASVAESNFGNVYIVVTGSEPNRLPVLIDQEAGLMYLTSEEYVWAVKDEFIKTVTAVRVSPDGETGEFVPYTLTQPLPDYADTTFFVDYTDGDVLVTTQVSPLNDRVWLSTTMD